MLYLSRFNFTLKHVLGIKIGKVDRLSKRLDKKVGVKKNNVDQVFIKNYWIHNLVEVVIKGSKVNILEKIKIVRNKNKKVVRVVEKMKKAKIKGLQREEWQMVN